MKSRFGGATPTGVARTPASAESSRSFLAIPLHGHAPIGLESIKSQARRIVWLKKAVADQTYEIDGERLALTMARFFARNEFIFAGRA